MDQDRWGSITGFEQHAVGGAAAFQGVFQFKPVPLGAQAPQRHHPVVDRQLDRATGGSGRGHAHQ